MKFKQKRGGEEGKAEKGRKSEVKSFVSGNFSKKEKKISNRKPLNNR